jgi:hypothetical protein
MRRMITTIGCMMSIKLNHPAQNADAKILGNITVNVS